MKFFHAKKRKKLYLVLADGMTLATTVAAHLSAAGVSVLFLAGQQQDLSRLPRTYTGYSLSGDLTDLDVLDKAGITEAYSAIVATDDDNKSFMLAQMAQELFHVHRVLAFVNDPTQTDFYLRFGIEAVSPAVTPAREIVAGLLAEV